jgi:hypothetical protein
VRVPLNSLVIGLDSLTGPDFNTTTPPPSPMSTRRHGELLDTIGHLRSSSATISNVLNKVHLDYYFINFNICIMFIIISSLFHHYFIIISSLFHHYFIITGTAVAPPAAGAGAAGPVLAGLPR